MITRDTFNAVYHAAGFMNSVVKIFQRADISPSPTAQPIPAPLGPATSDVTGTKEVIEIEDSITEEITEMRTDESPHRWVRVLLISILNYLLIVFIISLC